jgi:hypothetical protein
VFGNTDATVDPRLSSSIERTIGGVSIHVSHGHELGSPTPVKLLERYAADVIVYGHTHQQLVTRADGRLVVNPGAAGARRFKLEPRVARLVELDAWYRDELPDAIRARRAPHVTLAELARLTEWKMARGVWRAPNLVLVRGNAPTTVIETSTAALAAADAVAGPTPSSLASMAIGALGCGTAASAYSPEHYPFFDELVAAQVPQLGVVKWTLGFYATYAQALRERASTLGGGWTPGMVERALWAHSGGKAGLR